MNKEEKHVEQKRKTGEFVWKKKLENDLKYWKEENRVLKKLVQIVAANKTCERESTKKKTTKVHTKNMDLSNKRPRFWSTEYPQWTVNITGFFSMLA